MEQPYIVTAINGLVCGRWNGPLLCDWLMLLPWWQMLLPFSHTPDEAMSDGLAKACGLGKMYSVEEKISYFIENQTE